MPADRTPHPHPAAEGRAAARPSEIPRRGWWAILKRTAREIGRDRVMTEVAG